MILRKNRLLRAVAALTLVAALVAGCSSPGGSGAKGDVIKIADLQWQTLWINNAIAKAVIEKGYGHQVEIVEMTTPIMQQAIVKGDVDVIMEIWRSNWADWYKQVTAKQQIVEVGPVFDKAMQGWYVPRYIIEGDAERGIKPVAPDLKSVADLPKYTSLFQDPEDPQKGLLINCITGWQCAKVNRIKLQAYGLVDDYNIQEPGASAALDAAIAGAYKKGQPVLAYYWEPTWLLGMYDMVRLEEPPFTEQCDAQIQKALADEIPLAQVTAAAGCAYQEETVTKGINPGLKERSPEVVAFLEKMFIPNEVLNQLSAKMEGEKLTADQTAHWFFKNHPEVWRSWLPADKAEAFAKEMSL